MENKALASQYGAWKRKNDSNAYDVLVDAVKIGYVVSRRTESYRNSGRLITGTIGFPKHRESIRTTPEGLRVAEVG